MILKNYQVKSSNKIKNEMNELFEYNQQDKAERILFVSPTGSGKTITMSQTINDFNEENNERYDYTFLWISIGSGDLHKQSKEKVSKFLKNEFDSKLIDSKTISIIGEALEKGYIYFLNWESINNKNKKTGEFSSLIMQDSETTDFKDIISKTHAQGRRIIMIIDESHKNASTATSKELLEFISPYMIIEMTATPNNNFEYVKRIKVTIDECIKEQMIKDEIIINSFNDLKPNDSLGIIQQAVNKRDELADKYKKEKICINPLLLIQIGDGDEGKEQLGIVDDVLNEMKYPNSKIAKWFSGQKENLENISENTNDINILIFKQAVATGWDAPRSQILLKLRNSKDPNFVFEIQTMGRILRMPEQKYYDNLELNKAYVYCESDNILVTSDEEKGANIFKTKKSNLREGFVPDFIQLPSEYKQRVDYGDITSDLIKKQLRKNLYEQEIVPSDIFDIKEKEKYFRNIYSKKVTYEIITNLSMEIPDGLDNISIDEADKIKISITDKMIGLYFDKRLKSIIGDFGFAQVRSFPRLKNALIEIFYKELGITLPSDLKRYILANKKIDEYIIKSMYDYKEEKQIEIEKKEVDAVEKSMFQIQQEYFPDNYEKTNFNKNAYANVYLNPTRSRIEQDFEQYLDSHSKVKFWYKNGANRKDYFGINYQKDGIQRTFYPDFIVLFDDDSIGIYDTKLGFTTTDEASSEKYNGLKNYSSKYACQLKNKVRFGLVSYNSSNNFVVMMRPNYIADTEKWLDFDKSLD